MAIAEDAFTFHGIETANFNFTHTPVGTPRGVIVLINQFDNVAETVTVTYGGLSLIEMSLSPMLGLGSATDTDCTLHAYFLGSGLPTGAQTVAVTKSGANSMRTGVWTVTADADTEEQDMDDTISSVSLVNPSAVLALGGNECFCCEIFKSGHNVVTSISPLTNWTADNEEDLGVSVQGLYSYDIIGTADVTMGWTQTAEDATCLGAAIKESAGGPAGNFLPASHSTVMVRA